MAHSAAYIPSRTCDAVPQGRRRARQVPALLKISHRLSSGRDESAALSLTRSRYGRTHLCASTHTESEHARAGANRFALRLRSPLFRLVRRVASRTFQRTSCSKCAAVLGVPHPALTWPERRHSKYPGVSTHVTQYSEYHIMSAQRTPLPM